MERSIPLSVHKKMWHQRKGLVELSVKTETASLAVSKVK